MTGFAVVRLLDGDPVGLRARWERVLAEAPPPGRPGRVAWMEPLTAPGFPRARCAAIDVQWFDDADRALANEAWLAAADAELGRAGCQVVAEQVVLRGADWFAERWRIGGERYKMLSFGRRNPVLTPRQLSERWRGESGRLGGEELPRRVRGQAYVQNHPVLLDGLEWPYDAVTEVWFDRVDDMRQRAAWFATRSAGGLWSPDSWSVCVREIPLEP